MARALKNYPVTTITKAELDKLKSTGPKKCFEKLKQLSASRGLIYPTGRARKIDMRFRPWFDADGNLCQQNYAVDLHAEGGM